MTTQKYYLAQVNVAKARGDINSPIMQEFKDNLARINALAENHTGFIWRLKDESGDATEITFSDEPNVLVNMSLWTSVSALKHFMFKTEHIDFMKRKKEWFELSNIPNYVLWWIPANRLPTLDEAKEKLDVLRQNGDTPKAFSFKQLFSAE